MDLPIRHGVAEQTDAGIHGLLGVEAGRAEVFCSHRGYLVGMKIDHLKRKKKDQRGLPTNFKKRILTSMFEIVLGNMYLMKVDAHLDVLVVRKTSRHTG